MTYFLGWRAFAVCMRVHACACVCVCVCVCCLCECACVCASGPEKLKNSFVYKYVQCRLFSSSIFHDSQASRARTPIVETERSYCTTGPAENHQDVPAVWFANKLSHLVPLLYPAMGHNHIIYNQKWAGEQGFDPQPSWLWSKIKSSQIRVLTWLMWLCRQCSRIYKDTVASNHVLGVGFVSGFNIRPTCRLVLNVLWAVQSKHTHFASSRLVSQMLCPKQAAARNKHTRPEDMIEVVKDLKPLPGAKEFLDWLKPLVPRILLLTDQWLHNF